MNAPVVGHVGNTRTLTDRCLRVREVAGRNL